MRNLFEFREIISRAYIRGKKVGITFLFLSRNNNIINKFKKIKEAIFMLI